jgi:hypothetical protein
VVIEKFMKYSEGRPLIKGTDMDVVNKCVAVSLLKRSRNGHFTHKTAVRRFQK